MANANNLSADHQERLSKIMSVPTTQVPNSLPSYQAQVLTPQDPNVKPADALAGTAPQLSVNPVAAVPSAPVDVVASSPNTSGGSERKSNSLVTILIVLAVLIGLGGYTYFWLIYFKFL